VTGDDVVRAPAGDGDGRAAGRLCAAAAAQSSKPQSAASAQREPALALVRTRGFVRISLLMFASLAPEGGARA
jgi:hypothetical protein